MTSSTIDSPSTSALPTSIIKLSNNNTKKTGTKKESHLFGISGEVSIMLEESFLLRLASLLETTIFSPTWFFEMFTLLFFFQKFFSLTEFFIRTFLMVFLFTFFLGKSSNSPASSLETNQNRLNLHFPQVFTTFSLFFRHFSTDFFLFFFAVAVLLSLVRGRSAHDSLPIRKRRR